MARVDPPAGDEIEIRQAIDEAQHRLRYRFIVQRGQFCSQPLGPAAHGPALMQMGCRRMPAGQDEGPQRVEFGVQLIDLAFQALDLRRDDPERCIARVLTIVGHAEISPEIEQVILDSCQHGIERRKLFGCGVQAGKAGNGIGFIDGAVSCDPQVRFGDPLAAAQRRGSGIAGARINLV